MGQSPEWGAAAGLNTQQIVALVRARRDHRPGTGVGGATREPPERGPGHDQPPDVPARSPRRPSWPTEGHTVARLGSDGEGRWPAGLPEPRPARTGPVQVVPTVLAPSLLGTTGSADGLAGHAVPERLGHTGFAPRLAPAASPGQGQHRPAGASSTASLPRSGPEADGGWAEVRSQWAEPGRERLLSRIGTMPTVAAALTALAGVVLLSTAVPAQPPAPRHGEQTASKVGVTTVAEWERAAPAAAPSGGPAPSAAHAR